MEVAPGAPGWPQCNTNTMKVQEEEEDCFLLRLKNTLNTLYLEYLGLKGTLKVMRLI